MAKGFVASSGNAPFTYSEKEIDTGQTWVDGKKIYAKAYSLTISKYLYIAGPTNVSDIIKVEGMVNTKFYHVVPINQKYGEDGYSSSIWVYLLFKGADSGQHICNEGDTFYLNDTTTLKYGRDDKVVTKTLQKGQYTATTSLFGGTDPIPGQSKYVYFENTDVVNSKILFFSGGYVYNKANFVVYYTKGN